MTFPRLHVLVLATFVVAVNHPAMAVEANSCPPPQILAETVGVVPYPTASQRAFETGATMLMVSIPPNGVPTGAIITRSSGAKRLDDAVQSEIVSHWRWKTSQDACPVFQQPVTEVFFLGNPPKADGAVAVPFTNYPADAIHLEEQGDTYITFTLGNGGVVQNALVAYGSGYGDLDNQALAIAKASPNLTAGKPAGEFTVVFRWKLPAELAQSRIVTTSRAHFLCKNGSLVTDKRRCR